MGWFSRKRPQDIQQKLARAELFQDTGLCLMLHFPSMATVSYATFPSAYCGEVQRFDGPRWLCRYLPLKNAKTAEARDPVWEPAAGAMGSRIESAYQRFLHFPAGTASNTNPRVFYETARRALQELYLSECTLVGLDDESPRKP